MNLRMLILLLILILLGACDTLRDRDSAFDTQSEPGLATVGVKTFRQVFQQLTVATGLNGTNTPTVQSFFNMVSPSLSADGNAQTVSPTMLLAMTSLTGFFCDQLIRKELPLPQADRKIYRNVVFTEDQRTLTEDIRRDLGQQFAGFFWQREMSEEEMTILLEAMKEAETGRPLAAAETRALAIIPCVVTGSSLDAIKN